MASPPTQIATCPPVDVLGQLVSGSLDEEQADGLFEHVDSCSFCQNKVDELAQRADSVLAAARNERPNEEQPVLSGLIRKAQNIASNVVQEPPIVREAVSVDGFVSGLRRCGLFPEQEVDALLSDVSAADSSSMAKELVGKKKLTPFQARVLLKGRWKGLVLGNYVILEKLGQGGMGSVFKAKHRRLGRVVCVKVVNSAGRKSPRMLERFRNEARTVAALSHPNFVVAHDADEAEGVPFLVMEFIEGSDLSKHIAKHGPLSLAEALNVTQQAAVALQYAHDQGVTHRDIKPHNLLITVDPDSGERNVKILDLGLARFDSLLGENMDASQHAAMTNTGVIMGTVDYMSPEQALRSRDADNRSDIYSLGCTMHYLLTGNPVFDGDTLMARLIAHRESPVPSLEQQCPGAPPGLDAVFERMLAKNPLERYQSMDATAADLKALMNGQVPSAATGRGMSSNVSVLEKRRQSRRRPAYGMWVAVCVTLCLLIGAGVAVMLPETDSNTTPGTNIADNDGDETEPPQTDSENVPPERTGPDPTGFLMNPGVLSLIGSADDIHFGRVPTMGFGGPPEIVAIVPQTQFDDKQYRALEKAFTDKGMEIKVAAPQLGPLTPIHDKEFQLYPQFTINDLIVDDVDIAFVVGGSIEDFKHKSIQPVLATFLNSSTGMRRVIGATSPQAFEVLRDTGVVDSCVNPHSDSGYSYGRIGHGDGSIVWASKQNAIGTAVERAFDIRKAATTKGLHRGTLGGYGNGRALVVIPMEGFHGHEYQMLKTVLDSHGVEQVVASVRSAEKAVSKDGKTAIPVKLSLDEIQANLKSVTKNIPFDYLYDYVFVVGGDQTSLKEGASDELSDLLAVASSGRSVVAGLSNSVTEVFELCPAISDAELKQGKKCRRGETKNGATIAIVDELKSQTQMDEFFSEAQRLRREAIFSHEQML